MIIVCDDDAVDRKAIERAGKEVFECELIAVSCCSDLIDFLDRSEVIPAVIIIDLNMSPVTGDECCQRLRRIGYTSIPIVMTSSGISPKRHEEIFEKGAFAFMPKRFTQQEQQQELKHIKGVWLNEFRPRVENGRFNQSNDQEFKE